MKLFRSVLSPMIAGSVAAILGGPMTATAQDPRNPQLPDSGGPSASTRDRDRASDGIKLLEARREIAILEARIAVRKAEIEEITARARLRQARETLAAVSADGPKSRLTMEDVRRPPVPFPESHTVLGLPPETERRLQRDVLIAVDARNRPILDALDKKVVMAFPDKTPLEDVLKYVRTVSKSDKLPNGIPITVDPDGMANPELTMRKEVEFHAEDEVRLRTCLKLILYCQGLTSTVKDGLLVISAIEKEKPK